MLVISLQFFIQVRANFQVPYPRKASEKSAFHEKNVLSENNLSTNWLWGVPPPPPPSTDDNNLLIYLSLYQVQNLLEY